MWWQWLAAIGDRPDDSDADRIKRKLLIAMAVLMSGGGLIWGALAGGLGLFWPCVIPLTYSGATAVNLTWLWRTKNFESVRFVQLCMSMFLPFLFQLSIGGFANSGAGMLWAMLSLLGALTFGDIRFRSGWLALFCMLTVLTGLIDPLFAPNAPDAPPEVFTAFFVLNITIITSIVFGLTTWLLNQRDVALQAAHGAQVELRRKNAELRNVARQAEDATQAKSKFLANMSHELRTPLNAVLGMSELLTRTELTPTQQRYTQSVRSSGQLLLALISDILDVSKIEANALELELGPVDVRKCVKIVVEMVRALAEARGLNVRADIDPEVPNHVLADNLRLQQILMNLLGNAVKFTETGEVAIRVKAHIFDGAYAGLIWEVSDTGIGIEPDRLGILTEAFVQADGSTARQYGGTGLGLTIAHNLVELHGGTLEIRSAPGNGTTIHFVLPAPKATPATPPLPDSATIPPLPEGLRVLIVEDHPVNRLVVTELLKVLECEVVHSAENGQEALERLSKAAYDVVLLDLMMPVMDGLETARRIRALNRTPQPSIVALTASATEEDKNRCLEAGMDLYLSKPIRLDQLRETILEAIDLAPF